MVWPNQRFGVTLTWVTRLALTYRLWSSGQILKTLGNLYSSSVEYANTYTSRTHIKYPSRTAKDQRLLSFRSTVTLVIHTTRPPPFENNNYLSF